MKNPPLHLSRVQGLSSKHFLKKKKKERKTVSTSSKVNEKFSNISVVFLDLTQIRSDPNFLFKLDLLI